MKNSDTIGNRSRDIPVCGAVLQPLRHRVPLESGVQRTMFGHNTGRGQLPNQEHCNWGKRETCVVDYRVILKGIWVK
jgi:hypothetical protein